MIRQDHASEVFQRTGDKLEKFPWEIGHISSFVPIFLPAPPYNMAIPPNENYFSEMRKAWAIICRTEWKIPFNFVTVLKLRGQTNFKELFLIAIYIFKEKQ